MLLANEKYPVTGENLEKLDTYVRENNLNIYVKVYPDYTSRNDGTPIIHASAGSIWDNVIRYCNSYYDGGCLEICMLEEDEEVCLFHIEEGSHYLPLDVDYILGGGL